MSSGKKTVLITGCSDGGLGAALAVAFHQAGAHVYATARTPSKMRNLEAMGIETLQLDVLDDKSIQAAVAKVPALDILVNNAGIGYSMPVADVDIAEAKKMFDVNVWSYLTVTQAFLPLLLQSKGTIVNNTSIAAISVFPFQSSYHASKAAISMFSSAQRLELQPFGVKVVELKTGSVRSNFFDNKVDPNHLPKDSIYAPAREIVERIIRGDDFHSSQIPADKWASGVVSDVIKTSPPSNVWRGGLVWPVWFTTFLPTWVLDFIVRKATRLDQIQQKVRGE